MERRPYFIFGDILACVATGAAAGWLVYAIIPGGWFALVGMVLGMALGMLVGLIGGILFTPFFGALEIALPTGLAGMLSGMLQPMIGGGLVPALWTGALTGFLCLAFTYVLQAMMHGEVR